MRRFAFALAAVALVSVPASAAAPRRSPEEVYAPKLFELGMRDLGELSACYQARRDEADRGLERLRSVSVRVKPDGTLGRITVSPASAVSPELKQCFLAATSDWTVPPPANGRELRLRFTRAHFSF